MKIGKKFTKGDILKGGGGSGGGSTARGGRSLWGTIKRAFGRGAPKRVLAAKKKLKWSAKNKEYFEDSPGQIRKRKAAKKVERHMKESEIKKRQKVRLKEIAAKKASKIGEWELKGGKKEMQKDLKDIRRKQEVKETEKKRVKDIRAETDKATSPKKGTLGKSDVASGLKKAVALSTLYAGAESMSPERKKAVVKKIVKKKKEEKKKKVGPWEKVREDIKKRDEVKRKIGKQREGWKKTKKGFGKSLEFWLPDQWK